MLNTTILSRGQTSYFLCLHTSRLDAEEPVCHRVSVAPQCSTGVHLWPIRGRAGKRLYQSQAWDVRESGSCKGAGPRVGPITVFQVTVRVRTSDGVESAAVCRALHLLIQYHILLANESNSSKDDQWKHAVYRDVNVSVDERECQCDLFVVLTFVKGVYIVSDIDSRKSTLYKFNPRKC